MSDIPPPHHSPAFLPRRTWRVSAVIGAITTGWVSLTFSHPPLRPSDYQSIPTLFAIAFVMFTTVILLDEMFASRRLSTGFRWLIGVLAVVATFLALTGCVVIGFRASGAMGAWTLAAVLGAAMLVVAALIDSSEQREPISPAGSFSSESPRSADNTGR